MGIEQRRDEWVELNKKFQKAVFENGDGEMPKVTLALSHYQIKANEAFAVGDYDTVELNMRKFEQIANEYLKQHKQSSEWNNKVLPSQESKKECVNLCEKLGYANSGVGITKLLNQIGSDFVKYKPYTEIERSVAIEILKKISKINKKASDALKKVGEEC